MISIGQKYMYFKLKQPKTRRALNTAQQNKDQTQKPTNNRSNNE